MTRDWRYWATTTAYGCFLVLGAIHSTFFLAFSLADVESFPGAPLIGVAIVAGITGISLALVLWRDWPLLILAALSIAPPLVEFGVIRWPAACANFWTDGLCVSVVGGISALVLLFVPFRFFLFKKGSALTHRLILIGVVASASWAAFLPILKSDQIRSATTVLRSVFNTPPSDLSQSQASQAIREASKASRELESMVGLIIVVPLAWTAIVALVELLRLRARARHPVTAPRQRVVQERALEPVAGVAETETRNWRWWATRVAYGSFLALGSIDLFFFLVDFLPLDEGCSMGLAMFGLIPLMAILPAIACVAVALALVLWREWPLLIMAVITVASQLVSLTGSPMIGQVPLPELCTNVWTSGLCHSVVSAVGGLVLLYFSLQFFLFSQPSQTGKRRLLIGLVASALWAVLIAVLNLEEIHAAIEVIGSLDGGDKLGAAARQLRNLFALAVMMPALWIAITTVQALVKRSSIASSQSDQTG